MKDRRWQDMHGEIVHATEVDFHVERADGHIMAKHGVTVTEHGPALFQVPSALTNEEENDDV